MAGEMAWENPAPRMKTDFESCEATSSFTVPPEGVTGCGTSRDGVDPTSVLRHAQSGCRPHRVAEIAERLHGRVSHRPEGLGGDPVAVGRARHGGAHHFHEA